MTEEGFREQSSRLWFDAVALPELIEVSFC